LSDVRALTDLYNAFREEHGDRGRPMSHREAARRGGDEGKYETLRLIGTGGHSGRITEDVVRVLVKLGLDERKVRQAAGHQLTKAPGPFVLPERATRLTLSQRKVVLSVVDGLLSAYEQGREDEAETLRQEQQPDGRRLRAVASGQRSPQAQQEARAKARRARGKSEDTE
jgi:hypothetical protein